MTAITPGAFPYPAPHESAIWGHAVIAIGYDDDIKIFNKAAPKIYYYRRAQTA